ncbi:hypothetical protein VNI00_009137 [Paramarasmius palmivorus]|uniref:Uncharacterized protein n=1 Tax=Paramarasmius palmivorus TaxID=297713 RepID=A0AAW0CSM0_9AGAR
MSSQTLAHPYIARPIFPEPKRHRNWCLDRVSAVVVVALLKEKGYQDLIWILGRALPVAGPEDPYFAFFSLGIASRSKARIKESSVSVVSFVPYFSMHGIED